MSHAQCVPPLEGARAELRLYAEPWSTSSRSATVAKRRPSVR